MQTNTIPQSGGLMSHAIWSAQITADMDVSPGGRVSFREDDSYSLNLAPITVQVRPSSAPWSLRCHLGGDCHPMHM